MLCRISVTQWASQAFALQLQNQNFSLQEGNKLIRTVKILCNIFVLILACFKNDNFVVAMTAMFCCGTLVTCEHLLATLSSVGASGG